MIQDHLSKQVEHDTKRQLRTLLREQKRRRGLEDLHFFCKNILNYNDLTDDIGFHGKLCRHLESKKKFKLTLTPRGSLKSSVGTIGKALQSIIRNGNTRGLIASKKFTISTAFLSEIKGHIEKNKEFISLYGDLVGNDTWSKSEIIVNTRTNWKASPTLSCAGIDVTKVGMHYDWIIVDDPHDEENTANQDQIDKVIRWYKLLFSLLDPGGWMDITGTIWHYNDLYTYIIQKERERLQAGRKKRFKVFQRDSFEGTNDDLLNDRVTKDKLLWPERLSADYLKDQLIEQGPYIFSCQYRLNPIDDDSAKFKRSWIKTCKYTDIPKNLSVYSTIDPMQDESGNDYLAIVTGGMSVDWKFYILDVQRLKADEHETVDTMEKVWRSFKPKKMGFESVAWQKSYYKYVNMLGIMKGFKLPITQLKTDNKKSKRMRILGMVPYWKSGLFVIPTKDGQQTFEGNIATLVDELTRYPKVGNDDTIDALAYMNQLTHRPGVVHILTKYPSNCFRALQAKYKKPKRRKLGHNNVRKLHG